MKSRSVGSDRFFKLLTLLSNTIGLGGMKTVGCFSDGTRTVVGDRMVRQYIVTQRERMSMLHLCFSVQCVFQEPELCCASRIV